MGDFSNEGLRATSREIMRNVALRSTRRGAVPPRAIHRIALVSNLTVIVIPKVRLATLADAGCIAEMSRDYIEYGLGWSWTEPRVARAIRDQATNVAVVHERDSLLAFGIMVYGDETAHLSLLGVEPLRRTQGLGALLVSWLERSAFTAGIGIIRVEARADNPRAVAFYRKQGYSQTGSVAGYYRGAIDAIRLEKKLWHW